MKKIFFGMILALALHIMGAAVTAAPLYKLSDAVDYPINLAGSANVNTFVSENDIPTQWASGSDSGGSWYSIEDLLDETGAEKNETRPSITIDDTKFSFFLDNEFNTIVTKGNISGWFSSKTVLMGGLNSYKISILANAEAWVSETDYLSENNPTRKVSYKANYADGTFDVGVIRVGANYNSNYNQPIALKMQCIDPDSKSIREEDYAGGYIYKIDIVVNPNKAIENIEFSDSAIKAETDGKKDRMHIFAITAKLVAPITSYDMASGSNKKGLVLSNSSNDELNKIADDDRLGHLTFGSYDDLTLKLDENNKLILGGLEYDFSHLYTNVQMEASNYGNYIIKAHHADIEVDVDDKYYSAINFLASAEFYDVNVISKKLSVGIKYEDDEIEVLTVGVGRHTGRDSVIAHGREFIQFRSINRSGDTWNESPADNVWSGGVYFYPYTITPPQPGKKVKSIIFKCAGDGVEINTAFIFSIMLQGVDELYTPIELVDESDDAPTGIQSGQTLKVNFDEVLLDDATGITKYTAIVALYNDQDLIAIDYENYTVSQETDIRTLPFTVPASIDPDKPTIIKFMLWDGLNDIKSYTTAIKLYDNSSQLEAE